MITEWQKAVHEVDKILIKAGAHNDPVSIGGASKLECVGIGTDAAVFRSRYCPTYVFKIFAKEKLFKIKQEELAYQILSNSPYFPTLYGVGSNYLVLSYEEGLTLYDCLLQGVPISKEVIEDVERAREYIRAKGLNPRDIHLKNIILQKGRAKIIDLSEFTEPGNDFRWEHLKRGYEEYYHLIEGRPLPSWLLESIKKGYNQTSGQSFVFDEFVRKTAQLFSIVS